MKKTKIIKTLFMSLPVLVAPLMANSCGKKNDDTDKVNIIINKITDTKIVLAFSAITNLDATNTNTSSAIKNKLKLNNPKLTNSDLSKITIESTTLKRNHSVKVDITITVGNAKKKISLDVTAGKFIQIGNAHYLGEIYSFKNIDSRLYIVAQTGVYYSTNNGTTLTNVQGLPDNTTANFIYQIPNSKEIIVGVTTDSTGSASNLFVSNDGIKFTASTLPGPFIPNKVFDVNNQIVITGINGGPFFFDKNDSSWKKISIAADPKPIDDAFAIFKNGEYYISLDRNLYYASSLTASTWKKVSTFTGIWVYNIKKINDVYYALTEYGLYMTNDDFTMWSHIPSIPGNKTGSVENRISDIYQIPNSKQILVLSVMGSYYSTSSASTNFKEFTVSSSSPALVSAFVVKNCLFITTRDGLYYSFNFSDLAATKFTLLDSIGPAAKKGNVDITTYAIIDNVIYFGTGSDKAYATK